MGGGRRFGREVQCSGVAPRNGRWRTGLPACQAVGGAVGGPGGKYSGTPLIRLRSGRVNGTDITKALQAS